LELVDFRAIRSLPDPGDRDGWVKPVQAEVLVPDRIPLSFVEKVSFVSEASLQEAERQWNGQHPPFEVRRNHFADYPSPNPTLNFPHLVKISLTSMKIDKSNASVAVQSTHFRRRAVEQVTAIADVSVLAGSKGTFTWRPTGSESNTEFESTGGYWHWASISIDELPSGVCAVDYRISGIRWATLPFHVDDA
jgi:hypothetical protein